MKIISLLIVIGCCLALLPQPVAVAQHNVNLLENPSFEGDFEIQCSFPGGKPWIAVPCEGPLPSRPWQTVQVAKGWVAWWQPPNSDRSSKDFYETYPSYCGKSAPGDCVPWHMPEFGDTRSGLQDPPRIRSGTNSQKYFTFWSVHQGGVYQVVEGVRPGMTLRFSIYMQVWSATKMNRAEPNPHFSFGQTNMHLKVGIDPTGGTDPWSKDIIWSSEKEAYDKFERFDVQALARSNKVTVFTYSRPENPMEHNDVYLDDAELVAVSGGGPSSPLIVNPPPVMVAVEGQPVPSTGGRVTHIVKPGDTLFAIALQYGVPVDQIMALNGLSADSQIQIGRELIIALPPPKPVNTAGDATPSSPFISTGATDSGRGTVCLHAFADTDANGLRLNSELPLAASGAHFILRNAQGVTVADRVVNGQSAEYCFTDLPATTYRVTADPPPGYIATQTGRWAISLPGDAVVDIQLGLQADPTANQSDAPLAILLAGLGLAAVTAGGLILWMRRRRRIEYRQNGL